MQTYLSSFVSTRSGAKSCFKTLAPFSHSRLWRRGPSPRRRHATYNFRRPPANNPFTPQQEVTEGSKGSSPGLQKPNAGFQEKRPVSIYVAQLGST